MQFDRNFHHAIGAALAGDYSSVRRAVERQVQYGRMAGEREGDAARLQPGGTRWRAGSGEWPRRRALVPGADHPKGPQGADEAQGRTGDPRHGDLVRRADPVRRPRLLFLGELARGAVFSRLWRRLWLVVRQPMARVRPRNGVQDVLDERRRLQHRLFHDPARADDLALEPYPASHRHHHRRARSRNRRASGRPTWLASC